MPRKSDQSLEFILVEDPQEMLAAFPLISQYYSEFTQEYFYDQLLEMIELNDYRMILGVKDNKIVAVCGYWILTMLYSGRYIQISNLIVDKNCRSQGYGAQMLRYCEELGRNLGCKKFILDSYTENKKSHNLYFREGFYIRGFHFMKDL